METFLNFGIGIGLFMFFLLLFKKMKKQSDYLFLSWILVIIGQIAFYLITIYHFEIYGIWAILSFSLPLLGAPILFLYILKLTGRKVTWKSTILHLSSYVFYVSFMIAVHEITTGVLTAKHGYLTFANTMSFWSEFYAVPLSISGLIYCIWDLRLLKRHKSSINNLFSFEEEINLTWLSYIVYSFLALFIITSVWVFGATQFHIMPLRTAFALVGISLSVMLIIFGFYGFKQTVIFSNINFPFYEASKIDSINAEKTAYLKSGLTDEKIQELARQIEEYMVQEKPYLNDDLNLTSFAEKLNISSSNLSQVINQFFEKSFYDFINQYRIEQAKTMLHLDNYSNLSILGIAYECGFKSKSSFNRYFKKYCGISPSEFKKQGNK